MNTVTLEIHPGAGGEEATLFAEELFRMYKKFAQSQRWEFEGNRRELKATIKGDGVYRALQNESGVHRVQRVPKTERSGRIHTSTVAVAVIPAPVTYQVAEADMAINPSDLKIETFRSSGPGGQHMQKADSAVRITHKPSGIVVTSQESRSQYQNKEKALAMLRHRLYEMRQRQQKTQLNELRREQVGTMGREEKIRTYNFPQNRVTDHRLGKSFHNLKDIMDGNLEPVIKRFKEN